MDDSKPEPLTPRNQNVQQFPPSQYTVGWLCALPVELEAARAVLEVTHEGLRYQPYWDTNHYHLGSIQGHNIVIACLPLMGKVSAATTATNMNSTFPNLRVRLMVGIGGGIPSPDVDIRLGDIAVSKPSEQHGGVVEYDFGRWEADYLGNPKFRRIGSLNRPPALLLSLLPSMMSRRQLPRDLSLDLHKSFMSQDDPDETWLYPGAENDTLFQADYSHTGERKDTCEQCHQDKTKYVARVPRKNEWPEIHYGTIASGDTVVKNTKIRDWLGKHENAICVEMEAGGLMNDFPSLVIRGISDYSDSHKNSKWQRHAAAMASIYSKKLLQELRSSSMTSWNPHGLNKHFHGFEAQSPFFTGRSDESQNLEQRLLSGRDHQEQTRIVVYGKLGVGKSELCRRCAKKFRPFFWGIFRIDGSSEVAIKRGLAQVHADVFGLATKPALEQLDRDYEISRSWLETSGQNWLLILENVDSVGNDDADAPFGLVKLLPNSSRGSVIITTCNPNYYRFQNAGMIEVGPLRLGEAAELLLQICQTDETAWGEASFVAIEIVLALGYDTLGIVLAGSLIRAGLCTLREYLVLYRKQQELPISWATEFLSNGRNSLAAFQVSEQALRHSKRPECMNALQLLNSLAWLHYHKAPDLVFYRKTSERSPIAAGYYQPYQHQNDPANPLKWLPSHNIDNRKSLEVSDESFRQAIRVLASLSLVAIDAENGDMSMHPLIHLWVRKHMSPGEIWPSWSTTVDILARSTLIHHDRDHPPLHPHIQRCAKNRPSPLLVPESNLEVCKALFSLGLVLHRISDNMEARIILSTLLPIINRQEELRMGPIRFYVWILLATCEQNCDDTDIAIQHVKHTLALVDNSPTLKAVLAQDAIHDARCRLAKMYITTGKSREAFALLSAVVDDLHAQDPSSPLLLGSEDVLARIHLRLNQPESAIRLLKTVIERRRKLLGVSDVNFLRAQTISVEAYMAVGKLILAERVFSQVEDACKVSLSLQGALRGEMTELASKLQGMHDALNKQESLGDADDVNKLPKSKL